MTVVGYAFDRTPTQLAAVTAFCLGAALSAPFLADLIGWKIAGILLLPALVSLAVERPTLVWPFAVARTLVVLLVALAAIHILALMLTPTPWAFQVVKDVTIAAVLTGVLALAATQPYEKVWGGFSAVIIPFAVGVAVLGLAKLALSDRGYQIGFVINLTPGTQYPQGTSLWGDYNLTGLLFLIAAVLLVQRLIVDHQRYWSLAGLIVVLSAGVLVGSRRFLLLLPLIPLYWTIGVGMRRAVLGALITAGCVCALTWLVSSPASHERYRFGGEPYTVLGFSASPTQLAPPNRAHPSAIASTVDGMTGSRLDRMRLGVETILSKTRLVGMGWRYHELFSCRFSACKTLDYPHSTVLSAWLLGGPAIAILVLSVYGLLTYAAWKGGLSASVLLLCMLPYSLVSGDTLFSLPHVLSIGALVLVSTKVSGGFFNKG